LYGGDSVIAFRTVKSYDTDIVARGFEPDFDLVACMVDAAALRGTRHECTRIALELRDLHSLETNAAFRRFSKGCRVYWVHAPNT
jgi:hypothetical protein